MLDPPQAGEVRVDVAACAICHSDIHFAEGAWGGKLPAVYGHEAAGIVESVGAGVEAVRPGDRVVVSLIRTCGRCFFCTRGESYLCEAEPPSTPGGRLHDERRARARGHDTARSPSRWSSTSPQLAVVPDFVRST